MQWRIISQASQAMTPISKGHKSLMYPLICGSRRTADHDQKWHQPSSKRGLSSNEAGNKLPHLEHLKSTGPDGYVKVCSLAPRGQASLLIVLIKLAHSFFSSVAESVACVLSVPWVGCSRVSKLTNWNGFLNNHSACRQQVGCCFAFCAAPRSASHI